MNQNKRISSRRKTNKKYAHAYMRYRCESCGKEWKMYLEKGIEEGGKNHKPSPFTIICPYCNGYARDVSGLKKLPFEMQINDSINYFANKADSDCGVPIIRKQE